MFGDRKAAYKLPPTTIRDRLVSQEARRAKALQEQKLRRAQRFDSNRQLDLFADLTLGPSEDENDDDADSASYTPGSVAPYASMVESYQPPNAISGTLRTGAEAPTESVPSKKRRGKKKGKNKKVSKWADKCMYAELLEMSEDDPWADIDGLPENLETGWVAVGPIPVGKRCLAVTHQSSGIVGAVPNTTLRSRLLGKTLIPRFPSNLPPLTILDCVLDMNWRENGILHILDVIKWKGQDICDCEAPFRFWWRDTRLAELTLTTLPAPYHKSRERYQFPYPNKLLPIPYHTDTTLPTLYHHIIPLARSSRSLTVDVPCLSTSPQIIQAQPQGGEDGMEVEIPAFTFGTTQNTTTSVTVNINSDGLLLYVAEASYENGTSPLSSWIPLVVGDQSTPHNLADPVPKQSRPLDIFERLLQRRLQKRGISLSSNMSDGSALEVEMT